MRGMPRFLAEAGYTIVKVTEVSTEATRSEEGEGNGSHRRDRASHPD